MVRASGDHVLPWSLDHVSKIRCDRVRPIACSRPFWCTRILGWMASISTPVAAGDGATFVHERPPSVLRSKCTRHLLGRSDDSVLLGLMIVPLVRRTGLFLIGPSMPSGSR